MKLLSSSFTYSSWKRSSLSPSSWPGINVSKKATTIINETTDDDNNNDEVVEMKEDEVDLDVVQKQYDRYFAVNSVEKGGSFYLQSKIYRAKEMLDEFIKEKQAEEINKKNEEKQ